MSQLEDSLQGATCGLWNSAPNRFLESVFGGLPTPPGRNAFVNMMNSYCNDVPGFEPPIADVPFSGGQCPTLYNVGTTWTVTRNLTGQTFTATGSGQYVGPIALAGTQTVNGGIAGYISTGNGTVAVTDQFDVNEWSDFSWGVTGVSRVDGLPDNCGNPPIEFPGPGPQPGDDDGIDIIIPVEISPNVFVDVNVTLQPNVNVVNIPVLINNRLIAQINLGGINFNVGNGSGGDVDLSPVLDAIADTQNQIGQARGDILDNVDETKTEINENQQLIEAVQATLEVLGQQIARIGIPENLALPGSEDLCETRNVFPSSIFNAFFYLSDQLRLIRQINCTVDSPKTLLGRFQSTLDERVRYFGIPSNAKVIEITIENVDLPQRMSAWFTSAREGVNSRFGFYNFAYDSGFETFISGEPGQIWTRSTFARVPNDARVDQIRVLVEPEIIVAVYDSGIR